MGYKFEIHEWYEDITSGKGYKYHVQWMGSSLIIALWKMWLLKRDGAYCLKLEWRKI